MSVRKPSAVDRTEGSLDRLGTFLRDLPDPFAVCGRDGSLRSCNAAWARALGATPGELAGSALVERIHEDDRAAFLRLLERSGETSGAVSLELRLRAAGDRYRTFLCWTHSFPDRRLLYVLGRDVTGWRDAGRLKQEFLSTVSHELRTPLTSVGGSLAMLSAGIGGELSPAARDLLEIAQRNIQRLVGVVNQVLDVDRMTQGSISLDIRPLQLLPLVRDAIEAARTRAERSGVRFELDEDSLDLSVRADRGRLLQVVAELLDNATSFSPPGQAVTVAVGRRNGRVRLSVNDRGPGIPPEHRHRVFERFSQVDGSDARRQGGIGMGLSLARSIIDRHGGEIAFDIDSVRGTTFFFDLDEWREEAPPPPSGGRPAARLNRLLVLHGDREVLALIVHCLRQAGLDPDGAASPSEASRLLAEQCYAALVVDLDRWPGPSTTLAAILRLAQDRSLPIVAIAADIDAARARTSGMLQVSEWLASPLDPGRLLPTIERLTRWRARRPQVLHVENDLDLARVVSTMLRDAIEVSHAASFADARRMLLEERFDLVILDLLLPDGSGLDLLRCVGDTDVPVVVFSVLDVHGERLPGVAAALVKSRASNRELVETVRTVLGA